MNKIDLNGYVAISLEDYAEYQELKQPKIDYSKLKTGSVVSLDLTSGKNIACFDKDIFDYNKPFIVITYRQPFYINQNEVYTPHKYTHTYNTFMQDGKFIAYEAKTIDYITEVISY